MKNIKKVSNVSIVLYLLAIIMLGFAAYQVYACYAYVASIVEQGFVVADGLSDVVNYYMSNVTPYAFYASCLWGLGFLIQKLCTFINEFKLSSEVVDNEEFEITEDLEEFEETVEVVEETVHA